MNHHHKTKIRIALCILAVFLSFMQVFVLNRSSTAGGKLSKMQQEIDSLEVKNRRLETKIASASAIASISKKIQKYNLIPIKNVISLSQPLPIALSQGSSL